MLILQIGIIFVFLALGELIVWITGVPVPSSVIGMLLLAASLQIGWIRERQIREVADFLTRNLGFFFVPAGVSVMLYFDIFKAQWLPIVGATVISTLIVFIVTGQIHQWTRRLTRRYFGHHHSHYNYHHDKNGISRK